MQENRGFTLIELMLAIAVLAVLAAVAVPGFNRLVQSNQVTAATNELVGALNSARSEAVRRGQRVTICSSTDGSTCANPADWSSGWRIVDAAGTALRVHGALPNTLSLSGGPVQVVYLGDGMRANVTSNTYALQPADCPAGANYRRNITVNAVGRVDTAVASC